MAYIRNFRVYDSFGNYYELRTQPHFLHKVGGLGFKDNTQLQQIGNEYKPLTENLVPDNPKGNIFFCEPGSYAKYQEFARFIRNTPIHLVYAPENDEQYFMPCRVKSLSKTEIEEGHIGLDCSVQFVPLAPFYQYASKINYGEVDDGKVYSYEYPFMYMEQVSQTVSFDVPSHMDCPTKITIYGPAINPVWVHYVNNIEHATGAVNVSIPSNHKLIIDSTVLPYQIIEVDENNALVADRYQMSDFTTERFIFLQYGQNRISVAQNEAGTIVLGVEAHIEYETV